MKVENEDGEMVDHTEIDVLYRYYIRNTEFGGKVEPDTWTVEKHTPKGVYINAGGLQLRWVAASGSKRFAYPNTRLAKASLLRRTTIRVSHLRADIKMCETALKGFGMELPPEKSLNVDWSSL